jgi:hypothetical protein
MPLLFDILGYHFVGGDHACGHHEMRRLSAFARGAERDETLPGGNVFYLLDQIGGRNTWAALI